MKRLFGSHGAENLASALSWFFNEFEITKKVVSITGDNASNMRAAAELLNIKYHGCFAHILNLIVTNAIKNLKMDLSEDDEDLSHFKFSKVINKCRQLVGLFSHSTQLNEQLLEAQTDGQNKLCLIQDVVTR